MSTTSRDDDDDDDALALASLMSSLDIEPRALLSSLQSGVNTVQSTYDEPTRQAYALDSYLEFYAPRAGEDEFGAPLPYTSDQIRTIDAQLAGEAGASDANLGAVARTWRGQAALERIVFETLAAGRTPLPNAEQYAIQALAATGSMTWVQYERLAVIAVRVKSIAFGTAALDMRPQLEFAALEPLYDQYELQVARDFARWLGRRIQTAPAMLTFTPPPPPPPSVFSESFYSFEHAWRAMMQYDALAPVFDVIPSAEHARLFALNSMETMRNFSYSKAATMLDRLLGIAAVRTTMLLPTNVHHWEWIVKHPETEAVVNVFLDRLGPPPSERSGIGVAASYGYTRYVAAVLDAVAVAQQPALAARAFVGAAGGGHLALVTSLAATYDLAPHVSVSAALSTPSVPVMEFLLARPYIDPRYDESEALDAAVRRRNPALVRLLLADGRVEASIKQLVNAAAYGPSDLTATLLQYRGRDGTHAPINVRTRLGEAALLGAVRRGDETSVRALIVAGVDVHAGDEAALRTALDTATNDTSVRRTLFATIVEYLDDAGSSPDCIADARARARARAQAAALHVAERLRPRKRR